MSPLPDPFVDVRGKPMSELTAEQQLFATELRLREQIESMPTYHRAHYEVLFWHIDRLREQRANGWGRLQEQASGLLADLTVLGAKLKARVSPRRQ